MKIGVLGATGEVGRTIIKVLEERSVIIDDLVLLSSERSAGHSITYQYTPYKVLKTSPELLEDKFDFLLFSAGGDASRKYAPIAENAGNIVIDNSSAFRQTKPLIVPQINGDLLKDYTGIVANPNCSTIQLVLPLHPMHQLFEIEEIIVSTYQSVSGAGRKGMIALDQTLTDKEQDYPFPKDITNNVIPQIGGFDSEGRSEEENKMIYEIRKILDAPNLKIGVTTVRVPVLYGHSESVFVRFKNRVILSDIENALTPLPHIDYQKNGYLTPKEIGESDLSHISRLRKGVDDYSIMFWNVAHNVRLGAATNAVNIMQHMIESNMKR